MVAPLVIRLSNVRILPKAIFHTKKATLLGILTGQIVKQGNREILAPEISL